MEGLGLVLTDLVPPTPTEAAQMRKRHTARVQRPYGQNPKRPHGLTPREGKDTLAHHTDTLANPTRVTHKGSDDDVTDTSYMPRRAGRESVALMRALLDGLDHRPWAREPGKKKEAKTLNIQNVQSLLCLSGLWLLTTVPKAVG